MSSDRHHPCPWIALMIGNSRLHWGVFTEQTLHHTWDSPHLTEIPLIPSAWDWSLFAQAANLPPSVQALHEPDLWMASVVPSQTCLWEPYPHAHLLTLKDMPLSGLYPTLGIDRALAMWGAIAQWGAPALVIDAGTALTFSGANADQQLVGGAILPGLSLQMRSLSQHTAALPSVMPQFTELPMRWATNTPDAIRSGVLYATLASLRDFIEAWLQDYPTSAVALTGGDGALLYSALRDRWAECCPQLQQDATLVLRGIAALRYASP